ncbi:Plasmodium exported protein, unknown function [Plasmodium gallinaceum]|uniref:Plasmodium RESA N-terminal domain-containing protein n=1 Tax=Plasmodium gallinaceum TaxID=5849 RepID=A0A1J1GW55_PLAGA|nr:Plasmodium exported protein, unknown function [Plasmodium gallinaceum]CRG96557.1 Plasmodium exported protein, unknown function [Plasmodium gallinaceum]
MKNYPIYPYIHKGGTTKKKGSIVRCLFNQKSQSVSIIKFNKEYLRILAEEEEEIKNKILKMDNPYGIYSIHFNIKTGALIERMLSDWQNLCNDLRKKFSSYEREWEVEHFDQWYNKISDDIKSFHEEVLAEYIPIWVSRHNDKECYKYFEKKRKELSKLCNILEEWFMKYIKKCKDEWYPSNCKNVPTFYKSIFKNKKKDYMPLINNQE